MPIHRIYIDTSVFGGLFDPEFEAGSRMLFDEIHAGSFHVVTSEVVRSEIDLSPRHVKKLYGSVSRKAEIAIVTDESLKLREAYVAAGVVTKQSRNDALHVALATISQCSTIVSWNFKHIVNFQKIPLYNAVNLLNGYTTIQIHSPYEMKR